MPGRRKEDDENLVPAGYGTVGEDVTQSLTRRFGNSGPDYPDAEAGWLVEIVGPVTPQGTLADGHSGYAEVSAPVTAKWAKGNGGPAGDEAQNLTTFVKRHGANHAEDHETWDEADVARSLNGMGQAGTNGALVGAFNLMPAHGQGADLEAYETETASSIDATAGARSTDRGTRLATASEVRRLTPTECERLQALPDGWTHPWGPSLANVPFGAYQSAPVDYPPDSARYAACGDAVTATVAEWIADRIARVHAD